MPLNLASIGGGESNFDFQRQVEGGVQYWSEGKSAFKIPLEYIKFDEVRGKTYIQIESGK
jgi:hypothetical protein